MAGGTHAMPARHNRRREGRRGTHMGLESSIDEHRFSFVGQASNANREGETLACFLK